MLGTKGFVAMTLDYGGIIRMTDYIKTQFSKLSANRTVFISIILSLFIPALYGAILLTSKMSPTDHMDNLPVAVVNEDVGVMNDGEQLHVGNELVESLIESEALGWDFVDSSTAMDGLQNNDYYMVIVIPEDFSQNVTTITESDPKKLQLKYIQNEGLNFTAATITDTAAQTISQQLEKTIIEQFATTVVGEVGGGLEEAADGSEQLADGTTQLLEGTEELNESVTGKIDDIAKLAAGSKELQDGTRELNQSVTSKTGDIAKLASGSKELKSGTNELLSNLKGNSGDINKLAAGSKELHKGAGDLRKGTGQVLAGLQDAKSGSTELNQGLANEIIPGSKELAEGSVELADGVGTLVNTVRGLLPMLESFAPILEGLGIELDIDPEQTAKDLDRLEAGANKLKAGTNQLHQGLTTEFQPGLQKLDGGLSQLVAGQTEVVAGVSDLQSGAAQIAEGNAGVRSGWNELTSGAAQLDGGAAQIAEGNAQVNEGWKELAVGSTQLNDGAVQIADGNAQVNEGWQQLAEGSTQLNDGAIQLSDGSQELAEGLRAGVDGIAPLKDGEENIEMFASPVELAAEQINSPQYYRDTTAPFVMSLGLFVGILIVSLFMNFNRPAEVTPVQWLVNRFVSLSVLAIIQAALLLVFALVFIRIQATNPGLLILTLMVAAVAFSAIVLFLASVAGNVGRFIAVALVIMQLPTTGGDLPIIMLGDGIRSITPFLPFKYSIAGIRTSLMLGNTDQIFSNIAILSMFALIALALTFVVYMFKKNQNITTVEESSATPGSAF